MSPVLGIRMATRIVGLFIKLDQVGRPRPHIWPRHISAFMPRQQPKFTKLKYFVTLTCSHGGVKVKMMYMLQIYICHSIDWHQHWRNRLSSFGGEANTNYYPSKFTKSKYIVILTCSHGGAKVRIRYMLQIYIVPSVDWHQHWRIWSSSFRGEANTNYYPSKI